MKPLVVGFTTKDYQLYKHKNFKEILDNTDSIAISCNSIEDVIKASKIKKDLESQFLNFWNEF